VAGAERSSAFSRYADPVIPVSRRYFAPGQLQFITSSVYRRLKLFQSHRLRCEFVETLRQLGQETGFLLIGWVLMPEHFHLLIKPQAADTTSGVMQELKKRTGQGIVSIFTQNQTHPGCRKM
jgi:REP element-mobilizing transposase RayT